MKFDTEEKRAITVVGVMIVGVILCAVAFPLGVIVILIGLGIAGLNA